MASIAAEGPAKVLVGIKPQWTALVEGTTIVAGTAIVEAFDNPARHPELNAFAAAGAAAIA